MNPTGRRKFQGARNIIKYFCLTSGVSVSFWDVYLLRASILNLRSFNDNLGKKSTRVSSHCCSSPTLCSILSCIWPAGPTLPSGDTSGKVKLSWMICAPWHTAWTESAELKFVKCSWLEEESSSLLLNSKSSFFLVKQAAQKYCYPQ